MSWEEHSVAGHLNWEEQDLYLYLYLFLVSVLVLVFGHFAKFFDHQGYGGGDGRLAIPRAELERKQVALNARGEGESESPPNSTLGREGKERRGKKEREEEKRTSHPPSSLPSLLCSACPLFSLAHNTTPHHNAQASKQNHTDAPSSSLPKGPFPLSSSSSSQQHIQHTS